MFHEFKVSSGSPEEIIEILTIYIEMLNGQLNERIERIVKRLREQTIIWRREWGAGDKFLAAGLWEESQQRETPEARTTTS